MKKLNTASNVPANRNHADMETAQEREVVSVLVLYVEDAEKPLVLGLTEKQTGIAMHSVLKKDGKGNVSLFSSEDLRSCRDLHKPLNHNLYSIVQALEMLRDAQVCRAFLDFQPGAEDADPLCLENDIQAAVIIARLGVDLKTGRCVPDTVLEIIYGSRWDPELVMDGPAKTTALPYTLRNPRAGICNPRQIKKKLDKTIIGQDEVKEKLITAVYEQEMAFRYNTLHKDDNDFVPMRRQHVLLYGKGGSGKTALLEKLAEATDRPFVTYDVTTIVPPGCDGNSVNGPLVELLRKCDGDTEKASRGIICLDKWDQLFAGGLCETMPPVYRQALVAGLMQLMDGHSVNFRNENGNQSLNTSSILFVLEGEFPNLDDIVLERITGKKIITARNEDVPTIGFRSRTADKEKQPAAEVEKGVSLEVPAATLPDLHKFGMPSELLEHLTTVCRVKPPDRNVLVKILARSDSSPVRHYQKMLQMHNVSLQVTGKALEAAADKALEQEMGARGLASIFEKVLSPVVFRMAGNRRRLTLSIKPECFTAGEAPEIVSSKAK